MSLSTYVDVGILFTDPASRELIHRELDMDFSRANTSAGVGESGKPKTKKTMTSVPSSSTPTLVRQQSSKKPGATASAANVSGTGSG